MAQSNFKFTGNPKILQYQPKSVDYFTYLPQLRAKVQGAALHNLNTQIMDATGVAPQDLGRVQQMTSYIESRRNELVDRVLEGNTIDDSTIKNITALSRDKMQTDKNIKAALFNAKKRQAHREIMYEHGLRTGNSIYANRVLEESDKAWSGSFNLDGSINEYVPFQAPDEVDIIKEAKERMAIASRNMTPSQRASLANLEFDIDVKPLPSGLTQRTVKYKSPKDIYTNNAALNAVIEDINRIIGDETSNEYKYMEFMGEDFKNQTTERLKNLHKDYYMMEERPSGIDGNVSFSETPGAGKGTMPAVTPFPEIVPDTQITAPSYIPSSTPKSTIVKTYTKFNPTTGKNDLKFENVDKYQNEVTTSLTDFLGKPDLTENELDELLKLYTPDNSLFKDNGIISHYKTQLATKKGGPSMKLYEDLKKLKLVMDKVSPNDGGQKVLSLIPSEEELVASESTPNRYDLSEIAKDLIPIYGPARQIRRNIKDVKEFVKGSTNDKLLEGDAKTISELKQNILESLSAVASDYSRASSKGIPLLYSDYNQIYPANSGTTLKTTDNFKNIILPQIYSRLNDAVIVQGRIEDGKLIVDGTTVGKDSSPIRATAKAMLDKNPQVKRLSPFSTKHITSAVVEKEGEAYKFDGFDKLMNNAFVVQTGDNQVMVIENMTSEKAYDPEVSEAGVKDPVPLSDVLNNLGNGETTTAYFGPENEPEKTVAYIITKYKGGRINVKTVSGQDESAEIEYPDDISAYQSLYNAVETTRLQWAQQRLQKEYEALNK